MATEIVIKTAIDTSQSETNIAALRKNIKELKSISLQIGDSSSKDFKRVATAIGDAEERLSDMKDEMAAFRGSTLEKFNAGMQVLREKLGNLEIDDVTKQFKNLGDIVAANPLLFLGKIIIELVQNFDKFKAAGGAVGEIFGFIGESVETVIGLLKDLGDALNITGFAAQDAAKKQVEANKEILKSTQDRYDTEIRLAEAAGKNTTKLGREKLEFSKYILTRELEDLQKKEDATEEDFKRQHELNEELFKVSTDLAVLNNKQRTDDKKSEEEKTKKHLEELKTRKENEEKYHQQYLEALKKRDEEILAAAKKRIADLEKFEEDRRKEELADLNAQNDLLEQENKKEFEKLAKKKQDDADKEKERLKSQREINRETERVATQQSLELFSNYLSTKEQLAQDQDQREFNLAQKELDNESRLLDEKVQNEQITQAQADALRVKAQGELDRKQAEITRRGFERNKKFQKAQIAIQLASELSAIAANAAANPANAISFGAAGAIQAAVLAGLAIAKAAIQANAIESQQAPAFATGGLVSGPGTGTSDSIPARLSNGESVINANSTQMFSGILSAINQLGGGKAFAAGGVATNSRSATGSSNGLTSPVVRAYVVESEITNSQKNISRIIRRSTF